MHMVQISVDLIKDPETRAHMEAVLVEVLEELERGDIKYGPHPGPKRALGAIRAEVTELQTEVEAENQIPGAARKETLQVTAMGLKGLRDVWHG